MTVVSRSRPHHRALYPASCLPPSLPADSSRTTRARVYLGSGALILYLRTSTAYYCDSHILAGVSLAVNEARWLLLGRNVAGKTTHNPPIRGISSRVPGRIPSAVAYAALAPMRWRGSDSLRAAGGAGMFRPHVASRPHRVCGWRIGSRDPRWDPGALSQPAWRASAISSSSPPLSGAQQQMLSDRARAHAQSILLLLADERRKAGYL